MARFARQNESFCVAKWPFSTRKMIHFASAFFVKKSQGALFQRFRKCARFAHTRPSDFYFQTMAFSDDFFRLFVQFFQKQKSPSVVGKGMCYVQQASPIRRTLPPCLLSRKAACWPVGSCPGGTICSSAIFRPALPSRWCSRSGRPSRC